MKNSFLKPGLRLLLAFQLLAILNHASAQQATPLRAITYRLSMSRPVSHLFEVAIEVELPESATPRTLDFQMPRWSPGRYAVFDFAKNVQQVHAASGICPPKQEAGTQTVCRPAQLPVSRIDNQTWRVETKGNSALTFTYKVFGNDLSGTFSQLDTRHANYNGHSIYMYIVDHKPDPVKLTITPPSGWRIINGRTERAGQNEWQFPNWDIMTDTPTEIAPDWTEEVFQVNGKKYHVMVHSFGDEGGKRMALVRDIEKIVRAEVAMWGEPEFDAYTFLIHFAADDRSGDGMEHLTSTQIIEPGALGESDVYESTLGTVAHEFFHVWNVKRLRPVGLGPWDFTLPANTRGLWVAEGFTNYYGHLMLHRAGIWNETQFLKRESDTIGGIESAPGSRLMSAEASSQSAPFLDDAAHSQRTNLQNTAISYYPKGELIGFVLDLIIRGKTNGKGSLDEVMRRMYDEFYLKSPNATYYLRGRGYLPEDVQRVASEVAGFDFSDFFERHVRNTEVLPYDEALSYMGLRLIKEVKPQPFNAGLGINNNDGRPVIASVRNGSPAEDAGLQPDDELISLGGNKVTPDNWLRVFARYKQGSRVPVVVTRDRKTITTTLTLGEPDRLDYRIEEKKDATREQRALRAAWLKGS
ncbi:MAG TPA: PDZ domain-containing protein [Pyrinomonadaceae bacterium]|nr:PDZ domain-containing protein [Pyrinomonadaceae bacterium]